MKCKYCETEPNNATTKKGLYVCCCYMLHFENGKYTQHYRDKKEDIVKMLEEKENENHTMRND